MTRSSRTQAGFSFIEILVVMAIIAVLVSMVAVVIPTVQENGRRTKSVDNLRSLHLLMTASQKGWGKLRYNGKNFVLSTVAHGMVDRRNKNNLEVFFSEGDRALSLGLVDEEKWKTVTKQALKRGNEDFQDMTSYAGRRNADKNYVITPDDESRGVLIMADDDRGNTHHKAGFVAVYTNGGARFHEWDEFDLMEPEDPRNPDPWLGDDASHEDLEALSSD